MEGAKQSFRDQISMEGTNATGTLPNRQQTSATPSPRATYTPSTKTTVPFGKQWFQSTISCQIGWIWISACDGGDVCNWSLARSAAHVLDAKPEGDVHSIHSNPFNLTSFIPSHFHAVRDEARGGSVANPVPTPSASKQPVLSGGFVANPVQKPRFGLTCVPRCPD